MSIIGDITHSSHSQFIYTDIYLFKHLDFERRNVFKNIFHDFCLNSYEIRWYSVISMEENFFVVSASQLAVWEDSLYMFLANCAKLALQLTLSWKSVSHTHHVFVKILRRYATSKCCCCYGGGHQKLTVTETSQYSLHRGCLMPASFCLRWWQRLVSDLFSTYQNYFVNMRSTGVITWDQQQWLFSMTSFRRCVPHNFAKYADQKDVALSSLSSEVFRLGKIRIEFWGRYNTRLMESFVNISLRLTCR